MVTRWVSILWKYLTTPPSSLASGISRSLQDEIEFHLQQSVADHVECGLSHQEAQQAASQNFGSVETSLRDCYSVHLRDQAVCHRLHLLLTAVLLMAVGFLAAGPFKASSVPATADVSFAPSGDIVGQVLDENSQPIENAHVLAVVKTWPPNGYRQQAYMTTTTPEGRFSVDDVYPLQQPYEVQIAALADGHLLHSEYVTNETGGPLTPVGFQLESTVLFELRIEDQDGSPIAGVEAFPFRRSGDGDHEHVVYFQSADPIIRRSDNDGLLRLPYFEPGDRATIYLRAPGAEWETREIVVPTDGGVMVLQADAQAPTSDQS